MSKASEATQFKKGNRASVGHTGGRPHEFDPAYIQAVDRYLESRRDELTPQGKMRVRLPTIEGFALFIGVGKTTIYSWGSQFPDFENALNKILTEQHARLLDNGLSGDYNPTIAKLILSANHGMREKTDTTSDGKAVEFVLKTI